MLVHVLKKMINNGRMTLFLLTGFVLSVALIGSIPVYTNGILQKTLTGDLEAYQLENGEYPGYYRVKANFQFFEPDRKIGAYSNLKANIAERLVPEIPLQVVSSSEEIYVSYYEAYPEVQREEKPEKRIFDLRARSDMADHVAITRGRLFSGRIENGTAEVIVTERFLLENGVYLNETLSVDAENGEPFSRLKIVGIFTPADFADTYWREPAGDDTCFIEYGLYLREFAERGRPLLQNATWNYAFDYHGIKIGNLGAIDALLERHKDLADQYSSYLSIDFTTEKILERYSLREKQLRLTLWIIEVPVMILLFFYIFMISNLIIDKERSEIAVMKSRGKSTGRVFVLYLLESLILSVVALILGPPLGLFICTLMGGSNGFLEFVRRTPLDLKLSPSVYAYSLATLLFLVITMMVPTWFAAKRSIVQAKQERARDSGTSLWKRYFLDVVLLLISGYGFYRYRSQRQILQLFATGGTETGIDPLLFFTSTLFILGAGLFFLRLFPLIVRLLYNLGKKYWSPVMYCALLQVERTGSRGQFLMLFLIFSIAIGIFDANMARTLNRNVEDRTRYRIGADITLRQEWEKDRQLTTPETTPGADGSQLDEADSQAVNYREPPFIPYTQLEGVKSATRVYRNEEGKVLTGNSVVSNVLIQGIVPHEFGETAWFRNDLLPYHWYHYLNLLSQAQNAFLVSTSLRDDTGLKVGDTISVTWGNQDYLAGTIYGFVEYWPTYNPLKTGEFEKKSHLVVANLQYLHNKMAKDPYRVWLKKAENATDETVYESLKEKKLNLVSVESAGQELVKQKNDPLLKGINGALTQGFILIMMICTIGFLIYWAVSLESRTLQFGILRAMGLSQGSVVRIIVFEQAIVSGTAIFAGVLIGGLAGMLFVPFLELVFNSADQVPRFIVIALRADYLKIYAIIIAMLALGLVSLYVFMRRLKIGSALKLGED